MRPRHEGVQLTATDLAFIDMGFWALHEQGEKVDLDRLERLDPSKFVQKHIFIPRGDLVSSTPAWVEAGLMVAAAAIAVYKAYKSGVEERENIISNAIARNIRFSPDRSLDELIDARNELAARLTA
jgi:hypothetical protein